MNFFPQIEPNLSNQMSPKKNFNKNINIAEEQIFTKPDWTPDFSERINIESNSIKLALETLGMSMSEYNSKDINELKSERKIDCSGSYIYALNILIYYKQNSKPPLYQSNSSKYICEYDTFCGNRNKNFVTYTQKN